MTARKPPPTEELEGRQVNVALDDGSRIDDCQLVSFGRPNVASVRLVANGAGRVGAEFLDDRQLLDWAALFDGVLVGDQAA